MSTAARRPGYAMEVKRARRLSPLRLFAAFRVYALNDQFRELPRSRTR